MGRLRQFYGGAGVPLRLDRDAGAPAVAWQSHRARLRTWLDAVPDSDWGGPTRCALWDMTALVRHLVSGSQFLGYTLHQANRGISTEVLQGFDTHLTVQADANRFGEMTSDTARGLLRRRMLRWQQNAPAQDRAAGRRWPRHRPARCLLT